MFVEYEKRGQVSHLTDSFAFGIVIVELLTSLHPVVVREICDDSLFEELPTRIKQHHDGSIEVPASSAAAVADLNARPVIKCTWPAEPLAGGLARCDSINTNPRKQPCYDHNPRNTRLQQCIAARDESAPRYHRWPRRCGATRTAAGSRQ